jgi:hypothetical protein
MGFSAFLGKCTKSHDWLRIMHKIPRGTSINAKNPTRNFQ